MSTSNEVEHDEIQNIYRMWSEESKKWTGLVLLSRNRGQRVPVDGSNHRYTKTLVNIFIFSQITKSRIIGFLCGGSLISSRWILTAGYCLATALFNTTTTTDMRILLGEHTIIDETKITKEFNVDLIDVHPSFDMPLKWKQSTGDIAMVRLAEAVDLSVYTPVCLPATNQDFSGLQATVTGWGSNGHSNSHVLQELAVEIMSWWSCELRMIHYRWLDMSENKLCALALGINSCNEDTGCPVIVKNELNNNFILVGIVSHGTLEKPTYGMFDPNIVLFTEVSSKLKILYDC